MCGKMLVNAKSSKTFDLDRRHCTSTFLQNTTLLYLNAGTTSPFCCKWRNPGRKLNQRVLLPFWHSLNVTEHGFQQGTYWLDILCFPSVHPGGSVQSLLENLECRERNLSRSRYRWRTHVKTYVYNRIMVCFVVEFYAVVLCGAVVNTVMQAAQIF